MSSTESFQRGVVLFEQKRWRQAVQEFSRFLEDHPLDSDGHAYLGMCLVHDKDYVGAAVVAARAVACDPSSSYAHYAASVVAQRSNRLEEAERAISAALELDATNPAYLGSAAFLALALKDWSRALDLAVRGLEVDPLHSTCYDARAMALIHMGQSVDAMEQLRERLREFPEDAETLTTMGWAALHQGDVDLAVRSFSEALRIDAMQELAREGLLEGLKARNPIYARMLRYFMWTRRLRHEEAWRYQIVSTMSARGLQYLRRRFPGMRWLLGPLIFLDLLFTYLTWTASSFANMMLAFDSRTRVMLDESEIFQGRATGVALAAAVIGLPAGIMLKSVALFVMGLVGVTILIPLSTVFECHPGWPRKLMGSITGGLLALALFAVARLAWWNRDLVGMDALVLYMEGIALSSVIGHFLVNARPRRR